MPPPCCSPGEHTRIAVLARAPPRLGFPRSAPNRFAKCRSVQSDHRRTLARTLKANPINQPTRSHPPALDPQQKPGRNRQCPVVLGCWVIDVPAPPPTPHKPDTHSTHPLTNLPIWCMSPLDVTGPSVTPCPLTLACPVPRVCHVHTARPSTAGLRRAGPAQLTPSTAPTAPSTSSQARRGRE